MTAEIAIVGAGAVGVTAAYDLARAGVDVTVYERGPVAGGASGRAAGVCYDAFASDPNATLGREALERFRQFADAGAPFQQCPYVWVAQTGDDDHIEGIRAGIEEMQARGVAASALAGEDLAERFSTLRTDDVAVAGITENAGYTDTGSYTAWLAGRARDAGATIRDHTAVEIATDPPRVRRPDGTEHAVDAVLVAAGAHSKALLADAGIQIAMKPYRVQALVAATTAAMPMWYDATADCYARPHPDGLLAGDGTEEREADPGTYDRDANAEFGTDLRARLQHRLPDASVDVRETWAGLCTATPDRDPLVGELRDGIYVATGFQGQGFMRSPAIGRRIADQLRGGDGIDAFDPTRFDGDETFAIHEGMSIES